MNSGAATAFLPNFVGFPSLRGLHSSTVQPWRTPGAHADTDRAPAGRSVRRALGGVRPGHGPPFRRPGCPVSAASPASAPAAARRSAAARRRSAAAGRTAAAGVTPVVVAAVSPRRAGVPAADPPAARTRLGPRGRVRPGRPGRPGRRGRRAVRPVPSAAGLVQRQPRLPAPAGLARREEHHHDHRQDDAFDHGVTLLPFPRSGPPWAPRVLPRLARCRGDSRPLPAAKQS